MNSWCIFLVVFMNVINSSREQSSLFTKKCKNNQIIDEELFCDGYKDCRDGSDETVEACLHIRCPSFAFQCAYGACVSGYAECNGKQDCIDNSDETPIRCRGEAESDIKGHCTHEEFQCKSGECIQGYNACDGKKDCKDASDETVDLCASSYCPAFAFRCGYGACVSGDARCDGIVDCFDSSDESYRMCGQDHTIAETTPANITPATQTERTTSTTTEKDIFASGNVCPIEDIPNMQFFYNNENEIQPGQFIDDYVSIKYKCRSKLLLDGPKTNLCRDGNWVNPQPKCTKYCSFIPILGVTFAATCEYNGMRVPCNQPLKAGTRANIACQVGYRKPDWNIHEVLSCDEHGEWDYSPFRCEKICGTLPVSVDTVSNAKNVLPWNAAIYSKGITGYNQICGGTIINAKIVVSAAHCFWDEKAGMSFKKENYEIAAGKYYRHYNASEQSPIQFFKLSEMYIPPEYKGPDLFYQNDIAILVLNNFITFTHRIGPICMEWLSFQNRDVSSTYSGRVGGWGKVDGNGELSNELRVLDLPVVAYSDCLQRTANEYRSLITNDKFCIDSNEGETVCEGDSGAGFAVPRMIDGVNTYFLAGIISNGLTSSKKCGGDYCTACTNIQFYAETVVEYEAKYRPK